METTKEEEAGRRRLRLTEGYQPQGSDEIPTTVPHLESAAVMGDARVEVVTSDKDQALRACPFCGGAVALMRRRTMGALMWTIECRPCHLWMENVVTVGDYPGDEHMEAERRRVAGLWNRRADEGKAQRPGNR